MLGLPVDGRAEVELYLDGGEYSRELDEEGDLRCSIDSNCGGNEPDEPFAMME